MSKKHTLTDDIRAISESFRDEVLGFIRFVKTKIATDKLDILIASESSLKKDWLRPEEDEAWKDL